MLILSRSQSASASAWELVAETIKPGASAMSTTTDPIDTTGANLLVLACATTYLTGNNFSDSRGNSWVGPLDSARWGGSSAYAHLLFCSSPATALNHTFTITRSTGIPYAPILILAFYNPNISTAVLEDSDDGSNPTRLSMMLQSVDADPLMIAIITRSGSGDVTINSPNGLVTAPMVPFTGASFGLSGWWYKPGRRGTVVFTDFQPQSLMGLSTNSLAAGFRSV